MIASMQSWITAIVWAAAFGSVVALFSLSTAYADNSPAIVIAFVGDVKLVVSRRQTREISVGTTVSYIQRVKARRTVYFQSAAGIRENGPELVTGRSRSDGTSLALGTVTFAPPPVSQDGYYAEVIDFVGVTTTGVERVFASAALYFKNEGGTVTGLSQREYSDAQGPTFDATDGQGQRIRVRDAKVVVGVRQGAPVFLTPEEKR